MISSRNLFLLARSWGGSRIANARSSKSFEETNAPNLHAVDNGGSARGWIAGSARATLRNPRLPKVIVRLNPADGSYLAAALSPLAGCKSVRDFLIRASHALVMVNPTKAEDLQKNFCANPPIKNPTCVAMAYDASASEESPRLFAI
jgi:hypothetical protein